MDIPALNHHVGSTERVFVAHVNDLNDFYLHPDFIRDLLIKLGEDLYKEYSESLTKPSANNQTLNVGDYCACPSESEDWYRGLIRQLDSNGHATVFKIDYGDVQCVPIQFLQPLKERFFRPDRLAFHCSLVNLIKPLNGWSYDVIKEFCSRLTTTFLYAKFVNYNEIRDLSEVEITEKSSKTILNKDFEPYQIQRSSLEINDTLVYKYISMEILDSTQTYQIRILYYISPSRFYVYLREKMSSHTYFQNDLQIAMQNFQTISSPKKYQPVVAQDNHAIWHRAVILDITADLTHICVYFVDIGQREYVAINNIRPLPDEFSHKPAFAIPCRLYSIRPIDGNQIWQSDDQVHDEFNRLMANNVSCKVSEIQKQICYGIEIDIPKVGDLGSFLFGKNLVTRTTMDHHRQKPQNSGQSTQQSFVRSQLPPSGLSATQPIQRTIQNEYYNPNNMPQRPPQNRMLNIGPQNSAVQKPSNTLTAITSSLTIITVPPQDGYYIITQVHSATEFYGHSQKRIPELDQLSKYLEDYYNNAGNDQSLSVTSFLEGAPCVIQQGDKYYRVIIKHRESDSRVLVKLVDRGDEIIVDASELLQLDNKYCSIAAFAQPFRLRGYDESQNSANLTRTLKRVIHNQRVHISQLASTINGFYPVEVTTADNQSVNQTLLSSDKNSVTSPIANTRPAFNQPSYTHIESQVFNNSTKHHSAGGHDSNRRSDMGPRTNDVLPTVPKMLTAAPRAQPGRFGVSNQPPSAASSSNEPTSRFANFSNRNQQPPQTTSSNSMWNNDQSNKPSFGGAPATQLSFGQQQAGSSQFSGNPRPDDNKPPMVNNQTRFPSTNYENPQSSSSEQRRSFSGYSYDDKPTSGNSFQQNNNGNNENNFQRDGLNNRGNGGGGFNNRGIGGGFTGRGGRGNFNDRNMNRNNDENNNDNGAQSFGGFSRRGGGFGDRGSSGNFQGRGGFNRNQDEDNNDNNMQRSQNFNSNRGGYNGGRGGGGFQNRRDQGEHSQGGDFNRRGGFGGRGGGGGGQREGGFGGRGASRSGFGGDSELRLTADKNDSTMAIGNWTNPAPTPDNFDAGDRFLDNQIPKESFQFVISHIEAPNDFFIQLLSKGDEVSKLSETLLSTYKQSPETKLNLFQTDQPCLAKSSDGCWYRAIVLLTGVSKIKVRFIDFGDTTEVASNTVRLLAKKHCSTAPYAYRCTFKDVEAIGNSNTTNVVDQCVDKEFTGKIQTKTPDGKFILESEDFLKLLLDANTIKVKSENILKRIKCSIAHNEIAEHRFFIHDDQDTVDKIAELIEEENKNAPVLSLDEVKQLEPNTIVLAVYEDEPFRAVIQSDESDENVNVCYVDYGNTSSSPKTSLKRCSEQLSLYPHQAKQCQFYGVSTNNLDNAFKHLEENSDSETIEISIINQKNNLYNVLVFIDNQCINEKFGYDPNVVESNDVSVDVDDQSSTTTATTVKEQEQPSSVAEKEISDENSPDTSEVVKSEKNESETEEISSKYHQGLLTHIEQNKPYVYLQLIPESEPILNDIHELIEAIVQDKKQNTSYEVGDHVIAQFSVDDDYYRARIESCCSSTQTYTVYFLDYGNVDQDVPIDHLFSYSDDLKEIEPQARGYLLGNIHLHTWIDHVRPLLETEKLETDIEFYFLDDNKTTIHIKFDDESQIDNTNENETNDQINLPTKTFTANISATDNDCFYIHITPQDSIHVCELEEVLQAFDTELIKMDTCGINDFCIVSCDQNQYYRGRILAVNQNKYDIKRIDYGNILQDVSDNCLFVIPNEEIFKQPPLARQCRLFGVNDANRTKAMEDVIKNISITEQVTIHVENDPNDPCLFVILRRANNEIVNDRYQADTNNTVENENKQESDNDNNNEITLPDSVPAPANDTTGNDQQITSSIDTPQVETTHQSSDPINDTSSISTNQTIDFGENDLSTTTTKDETNNSVSSN